MNKEAQWSLINGQWSMIIANLLTTDNWHQTTDD